MAESKVLTGYDLSRKWFDFCFENPDKINPSHTALYFFSIEHCNRLGWKRKFGLPTSMAMEAIGIRSYNTYKKTLIDLINFGFLEIIQQSKNQYSSNVVALSNFNKALDKALDKALSKHATKQSESIYSIDKQINNEQITREPEPPQYSDGDKKLSDCLEIALKDQKWVRKNNTTEIELLIFIEKLEKEGTYYKTPIDFKKHFSYWKEKKPVQLSEPKKTYISKAPKDNKW